MANKYKVKKRMNSASNYVDKLFEVHSKILAVRVDLSYKDDIEAKPTFEQHQADLDRLLHNRRYATDVFGDSVGYVIASEQGELEEKIHCHALFLYDGQKVQRDVFKGQQIGEYWQNNVTNGNGNYFNCNAKQEDYREKGIGMIDHRDTEKRELLTNTVAGYLAKDEQVIPNTHGKKTFRRGEPPRKKTNAGRPRNS